MRTTNEQYQAIHEAFNQVSGKQQLDEISGMDALHLGLDLAGMVPVFGAAADLTNAALYGARGKKGMAALSLAAALPGVGQAATAGKLATKFGGRVGKAARAISPTGRTAKAAEKATKVAKTSQRVTRGKQATARAATAAAAQSGSRAAVRTAMQAGRAAAASKAATKAAIKSAKGVRKGAARTAKRMKVINPAFKVATRGGVLARGNVAQTYGFADPKTPAKDVQFGIPGLVPGEGAAAVSKLTSSIYDTLKKAGKRTVKGLENIELGSFQG
jgi:hypothetical protein